MEIETDKTTVGVPAPSAGVIEEIFVQDGDTVKAGQQLFKMKVGAGSPAASKPSAPQPTAATSPPPSSSTATSGSGGKPTGASEVVKVPPFADSVSEGDIK